MMTKKFTFCMLLLAAMLLASCNGDSFTIEGELADAGTQNIKIVYVSPLGVQSQWVPVKDGKFKVKGNCEDLTVVYIYNQQQQFLAHLLMSNGDKAQLTGTIANPYEIEVKGSDANEKWNALVNTNAKLFAAGNHGMIDVEIEKYIRDNKSDIVSTLLLLNDYGNLSDEQVIDRLLNTIDEDARPLSVVVAYKAMRHELSQKAAAKKVFSLMLYSSRDSLEVLNPQSSKMAVLYLWCIDDKTRPGDMSEMKTLAEQHGGNERLQIADITLDNDTSLWKKTIRDEATGWKSHYWAVGGFMNNSIKDLYIRSTPTVIVTDSVGKQLYRGNSVKAAAALIRSRLK